MTKEAIEAMRRQFERLAHRMMLQASDRMAAVEEVSEHEADALVRQWRTFHRWHTALCA